MAKVLFKTDGKLYYGDSNRKTAWDNPDANITNMRPELYHRAEDVYLERPSGYFKHMKSRFNNELYPLTDKEAMLWILKAEYVDIRTGSV